MQYTIQEQFNILMKDSFVYRNKIVVSFVIISLAVLSIGVIWPKQYKAESLIYVDNRNVITPLMQGAAVSGESQDIARNAKEIILGSNIINKVLEYGGWLDKDSTPVEREKIIEEIKKKTTIKKVGDSLIRIEFTDKDPVRAYRTTKNMAQNFVDVGKSNKIQESRSAYDFIEKQAAEYLEKLTSVDKKIKDFLSENPDARPGTQEKVTQRISALKLKYEDTTLSLREAEIKKSSIEKQLSGEAAMTISQSREGNYRNRITEMENQLETLLLTYTDTYPDVVRIKRQIKDLKSNLQEEIRVRDEAIVRSKKEGTTYLDASIATNPMYQELRSGLSTTETELATLQTRLVEMKAMLESEYDRMRRIQEGDAMMQTLTRDYEVNQGIYQDLLKRRENARISRSLDTQQKGATFNILEPAQLPIRPFGLSFIHFFVLGGVLGIIIPIGVVFFLSQIDGKIRSARYLVEELKIPVLAEVPHYWKENEKLDLEKNIRVLSFSLIFVILIYALVGGLKFMGKI